MCLFTVEMGSGRMDSLVHYNKCFYNKSTLVDQIISKPLSQIFKIPNLLLSTNCPLFYAIIRNPENYQRLLELQLVDPRYGGFDVQAFYLLSKVFRTYIVPHQDVLDEVNAILAPYENHFLVGMHIRCGNPLSDFKDQSTFIRYERLAAFSHCIKGIQSSEENRTVTLILTSDSTKAKKKIHSYNPQLEIVSSKRKAVHTMLNRGHKPEDNVMKEAFMEMLLLGRCKKMIGTTRSTFSLCAAAFQGQLPLLVDLRKGPCSVPKQIVFGWECLSQTDKLKLQYVRIVATN